jgi:hypothetical protein
MRSGQFTWRHHAGHQVKPEKYARVARDHNIRQLSSGKRIPSKQEAAREEYNRQA